MNRSFPERLGEAMGSKSGLGFSLYARWCGWDSPCQEKNRGVHEEKDVTK